MPTRPTFRRLAHSVRMVLVVAAASLLPQQLSILSPNATATRSTSTPARFWTPMLPLRGVC